MKITKKTKKVKFQEFKSGLTGFFYLKRMKEKVLIVIAGPTAIGKTALGIQVAKHFKTEIISADSRQFFKEMSIGTAKPSADELATVPHHFIDSHTIEDQVSVGSYEKEVLIRLEELFIKHNVVVMVGGSGLYINAVLNGFDELPAVDPAIRAGLNNKLEKEGLAVLQEDLLKHDPDYYNEVEITNPQRVIRALEIYHSTGKPFSSFRTGIKKERNFKSIIIGLNSDREELYNRINKRVDLMMEEGLLEEVKSLIRHKALNSLNTVGYSELFKYLDGEIALEEAVDQIKQNTRRFAKRQITWFKKLEGINWFHPNEDKKIISFIEKEMIFEKS
jgi:tRNA dimethylallyltransferase